MPRLAGERLAATSRSPVWRTCCVPKKGHPCLVIGMSRISNPLRVSIGGQVWCQQPRYGRTCVRGACMVWMGGQTH